MDKHQDIFHEFEVPDPIRIEKVAKFVRRYFRDVSKLSVLECGIARGGLAEILAKEGAKCFGVDINPRPSFDNIKIIQADINDGFPDFGVEFDVVFAGELMEHTFDDEKFLKGARSRLKPDGLLVLTVPNLVFGPNRIRMFFGKMPLFAYAPYHYHIYTKNTLKELLISSGFEILGLISSHVLFSTRRGSIGRIFELLGDRIPSLGAHLIVFAKKYDTNKNSRQYSDSCL